MEGSTAEKQILVESSRARNMMQGLARSFEVDQERDVAYAEHDGERLVGDFYKPRRSEPWPVLVAVHGGAWRGGSPAFYRHWGPFLAGQGIGLFAIRYRLLKPGAATYPHAVHDVRAAVQFVRGGAKEFGVDPDRIGLLGDSAGGHLSSLVALAGDAPHFAGPYDDPYRHLTTRVKAVVSIYGVYDFLAQWENDLRLRSRDPGGPEQFLGKSAIDDRRTYFEASPLSYATARPDAPSFLLAWGTEDDVVDPAT
jgi:acetyl esterase/lipase